MELGNIKQVSIVEQMTGAYLDYSMSVIVSRALPDVRDGLKPVHRRVLYAMDQMGLQSTKTFRKSAGTVGEVLKLYHPHGEAAVYDSLVRILSKDGQTNTASKWWDCGAFPTWSVRTQRGYEVTGTANHPLLVAVPHASDGRVTLTWKTIAQLAVGDYIVMDRSTNLWPEQPVDLHP